MHLGDVSRRKSLLFLKKKKQKDFPRFSFLNPEPGNGEKFFGSFFQERTAFVAHRTKDPGKVHHTL